jgi:hypothetical protein
MAYLPQVMKKQELAFGASDTVKTVTLESPAKGTLAEIDIQIPVWTNNPTCTVTLERTDGTVAWTGAAVSKGGAITYYAQFPARVIQGGEVLKATLSLAPGGSGGSVWITPFVS